MENGKKLLLAILAVMSLAACGNNGSDSAGTTAIVTTTNGTCSAGYVYSSMYGCLAQSTCSAGYGLYNGQCVIATSTTTLSCPSGYVQSGSTCVVGTTYTTSSCQGSCTVGYTATVWGCLPQGNCGGCFGSANGYCLGGAATGYIWYRAPY